MIGRGPANMNPIPLLRTSYSPKTRYTIHTEGGPTTRLPCDRHRLGHSHFFENLAVDPLILPIRRESQMPGRFPPSVSPHGSSAFWPGGNDTFLVVMLLSKIWLLTPEHAVVMVAVVAVGLVGLHGGMPHAIKRSGRCLDKTSFRVSCIQLGS